jgi:3-hydroxybutyryl-CoA dehydratase
MNEYLFEDIEVGSKESFTAYVTEEMMSSFAEVSGDYNPLHIDEVFAKENGFNSKVVFGMLTSSLYSRLVGMNLPGKHALLQGIELSFRKPVYVGDCLKVTGEVVYKNDAYKQLEIKAMIENQEEVIVSKAKIKVGVSE